MKKISILWITALLLFGIGMAGCKQCLCCSPAEADFFCIKGTDTSFVHVVGTWGIIHDSISYYQSQGYSIDTSGIGLMGAQSPTCGRAAINQMLAVGFYCVELSAPYECPR